MKLSARQACWVFAVVYGFLASLAYAEPPSAERVEWNKVPVSVPLKVAAETQIQFPVPVKVGLPASLKGELRTQSGHRSRRFAS